MKLFKLNRENFFKIEETDIESEKKLQNWIEKNPQLLNSDICILGKEVSVSGGKGRIDLLAINQEGNIIIIETKKYESPDELMGQVARYRNGIKKWDYDEKNKWKEISKNKHNIDINFNSNPQIYLIANDFDDDIVDFVKTSDLQKTVIIEYLYFKSNENGEEFLLFNEIANNISKKISSEKLKRSSSIEGLDSVIKDIKDNSKLSEEQKNKIIELTKKVYSIDTTVIIRAPRYSPKISYCITFSKRQFRFLVIWIEIEENIIYMCIPKIQGLNNPKKIKIEEDINYKEREDTCVWKSFFTLDSIDDSVHIIKQSYNFIKSSSKN